MAEGSNRPLVIKRKKVVAGDGHHGGAWKVAYADFVTAMMAFFMLMWLLGATTENQRKGIADYFNPTIPVNRVSGGGEGAFGGESVFSEQSFAQSGTGAGTGQPTEARQARGATGVDPAAVEDGSDGTVDRQAEDEILAEIEAALTGQGGESMVSELLARHVVTRLTDEGLIVEIFDLEGSRIFEPETAEATETLDVILGRIAEVFDLVVNPIAIYGHTRAQPVVVRSIENWSLSVDRADVVRRSLEDDGIDPARIDRMTGHADREPITSNPLAIRNNRIEVILLRRRT